MQARLTLQIDEKLIRKAKHYSRQHNKSLSIVVADFFRKIEQPNNSSSGKDEIPMKAPLPIKQKRSPTSPKDSRTAMEKVLAMRGILKVKGKKPLDEADYYKHLEEKYR